LRSTTLDKKLEELRAELVAVDDAYRTLTAPLAWAKMEAGIDPSDEDERLVREIVARRDKLWADIRQRETDVRNLANGSGKSG
jgi:DNA primase